MSATSLASRVSDTPSWPATMIRKSPRLTKVPSGTAIVEVFPWSSVSVTVPSPVSVTTPRMWVFVSGSPGITETSRATSPPFSIATMARRSPTLRSSMVAVSTSGTVNAVFESMATASPPSRTMVPVVEVLVTIADTVPNTPTVACSGSDTCSGAPALTRPATAIIVATARSNMVTRPQAFIASPLLLVCSKRATPAAVSPVFHGEYYRCVTG